MLYAVRASEIVDMSFSHFCVNSRNGATNRDDIIELRFIIWSSNVCVSSSFGRRMSPRS